MSPVRTRLARALALGASLLVAVAPVVVPAAGAGAASAPAGGGSTPGGLRTTAVPHALPALPPPGADPADPVAWYTVAAGDGTVVPAAVAGGAGPGPAGPGPAVVLLPGTDGLRHHYLDLAVELAAAGRTVVTGCWFAPPPDAGPDTVACPTAPAFTGASTSAVPAVAGLVALARSVSGGAPVVLVGHSRGGTQALLAAAADLPDVVGVVTSATVYSAPIDLLPDELPLDVSDRVAVPVLALHATGDPLVPVDQARTWVWVGAGRTERILHEHPGDSHALPFAASSRDWWRAEVEAFLSRW